MHNTTLASLFSFIYQHLLIMNYPDWQILFDEWKGSVGYALQKLSALHIQSCFDMF